MTGPLGLPRVLWAALFASTLIYILVLELMTPEAVSDWQALVLPFAFAGRDDRRCESAGAAVHPGETTSRGGCGSHRPLRQPVHI